MSYSGFRLSCNRRKRDCQSPFEEALKTKGCKMPILSKDGLQFACSRVTVLWASGLILATCALAVVHSCAVLCRAVLNCAVLCRAVMSWAVQCRAVLSCGAL